VMSWASHCTANVNEAACWVQPEAAVTLTMYVPAGAAATPTAAASHLQDQAFKRHETGCQPKKFLSAFASRPESDSQQSQAKDREHERIKYRAPGEGPQVPEQR